MRPISLYLLRQVLAIAAVLLPVAASFQATAQTCVQNREIAQIDDGGSLIPLIKNAPFSMTLSLEDVHPPPIGYTAVSRQLIKRDELGRLYKER